MTKSSPPARHTRCASSLKTHSLRLISTGAIMLRSTRPRPTPALKPFGRPDPSSSGPTSQGERSEELRPSANT